jgi:hypothetical protein
LLAVLGLLVWRPGAVQAHPHLVGDWVTRTPPGGYMMFHFGPGCYLGNGVWRGPFFQVVSNVPTGSGQYELHLFTGTEGTLWLRFEAAAPGHTVGTVDLAIPEIVYQFTVYKR